MARLNNFAGCLTNGGSSRIVDLSSYEYKRLGLARKAREDVIQVDAFDADIYRELR